MCYTPVCFDSVCDPTKALETLSTFVTGRWPEGCLLLLTWCDFFTSADRVHTLDSKV